MAGGIVDEEEDERRKLRVLKAYCGAGEMGVVPHTVYDPRCGRCVQRFWDLYHKDDFVETKSFLIYQTTSQGLIADKNIMIHELDEKLREANRKLSAMTGDAMKERNRAVQAEGKLADMQIEMQKLRDTIRMLKVSDRSFNDVKVTGGTPITPPGASSTFREWYYEWAAGGHKFTGPSAPPPLRDELIPFNFEPPEPPPLPTLPSLAKLTSPTPDLLGDIQKYLRKHWNNS